MKDEVPELRKRTKAFALRVVRLFFALPKTDEPRIIFLRGLVKARN